MASVATPSGDPAKEKKSKWRLSNPFNKDKDNAHGQHDLAPTNTRDTRDSAYGGSETTTTDASPNPSTTAVPTISEGQAEAQGATVKTQTDSRGKVVTTTTTTVTTTTTTTEGEPLQVPAGEEVIVRQDDSASSGPSSSLGMAEPYGGHHEPTIPAKNALRNKSPHGGHLAPQNQYPVEAPASPSSPTHHNFSYPGRQNAGRRSSLDRQNEAYAAAANGARQRPPGDPSYGQPPLNDNPESPQNQRQSIPPSLRPGNPSGFQPTQAGQPAGMQAQQDSQAYQPRQSTAQSIRTAAAGIHGAGEALRGAFNSSVARNTGASTEEIAKHDAIAQRGRQEVETGRFVRPPPPIPEVPTPEEQPKEKKSSSKIMKNVLRKKSPART